MSEKQDDWEVLTQVQKAERAMDYLNRLTGQKNKALNPSGKPTANCKMIIDRLKEGYTKDDFRKVITGQHKEWSGDEKMEKYLRPSTLFRKANFENYLAAVDPVNRDQVRHDSSKPDPLDRLTEYLRLYQDRGRSWGYEMPQVPVHAARWWIQTMQEPCSDTEGLRKVTKRNAKSSGDFTWQYPYIERLLETVKRYLALPREEQVIIFGCVDEGIHWRGDSMNFFYYNEHSVYNEMTKMRGMDKSEYTKTARAYLAGRI